MVIVAILGLVLVFGRFGWQEIVNPDVVIKKEILIGSTFSTLASSAGLATTTVNNILESAKDVYNLALITAGKELILVYNQDEVLKELIYEISSEEKLSVKNTSTTTLEQWEAARITIEYTVEVAIAKGVIESSLYETMVAQGIDPRLVLALAETFAWQIDFAGEIQKGDSFKVIYEKKFRDGAYSHPGNILAAEFNNVGSISKGFYFEPSREEGSPAKALAEAGYYDESGNSLQKVFLKSPLQYKYISSGFSYGRYNPITKKVSPHRGIDYAANSGTPAVAVGSGTVIQAGWNGYYGISVTIRHNDTYKTVYGHFKSLARGVRAGSKVKQGQIIGYVGSTGLSTGPHLHYEMHKFGQHVNPFTVKVPPGKPIKEGDKEQFEAVVAKYTQELNSL